MRTLRVFEHQTVRVGEPQPALEGGEVTLSERDFQALVRFNDASDGRFFTVGHRRIRFAQYVGYLQIGSLGIEVLPKADRAAVSRGEAGRWHEGLLRMLEVATGIRLMSPTEAAQRAARASLLEIVAARFVESAERLAREGLAKGYRDEEGNSSTFKGRLLVAEHVRENAVRADRFYVRHSVYDRDITQNRILAAALDSLAPLALSESVASRAAACRAVFPEVGCARIRPGLFERIPKSRVADRYRHALALARMILEHHAPELRAGGAPVLALLFDMNLLWERYIAALFRRAAPKGLFVSTQEGTPFWKPAGAPVRGVRPDIVVRRGVTREVVLIADTKWRVPKGGAPMDDELKQMFVYNELFKARRAVLLYPSQGDHAERWTGHYAKREHSCAALHLGLFDEGAFSTPRVRREIEEFLESLLG